MPSAEVEGVRSVCAVGSWPCSSARAASWGVLSAAVKVTFRGCSDVRVVATGGGASTTGGGATVGWWLDSSAVGFPFGTADGVISVRGCGCSDAFEREGGGFEGLEALRVNQDNMGPS